MPRRRVSPASNGNDNGGGSGGGGGGGAADASADAAAAATAIAHTRETLLAVLGTACIVTIQLAEQVLLWRRGLGDGSLIPMWHGELYADRALSDVSSLLDDAAALPALGLASSPFVLLPALDPFATAKGGPKYLLRGRDGARASGEEEEEELDEAEAAGGEEARGEGASGEEAAADIADGIGRLGGGLFGTSVGELHAAPPRPPPPPPPAVRAGNGRNGREWVLASGVGGRRRHEEAENAFKAWLDAGGCVRQLAPTEAELIEREKYKDSTPTPPYPPHPTPQAHHLLPGPGSGEPPLSSSASQIATFALGCLALAPRELMRVVHSSERVLRGIAVEGSKEAGAGGSRPSGGFAGGSCGGVNAGTVGAKYVELSEGVRTPADAIDVHMRRRAMVGLQAAPPRLTPLERACGRSLKALHLLAHGAALFMQMHARCFLALRKKFYERRAAAGAPPLLPAPLAAAFQDECTEHEAREAQERAERRLSYVNRRVLRVWRERLDPNRLVKNEDTFLAPLVLARRRKAAIVVQSAWRGFVSRRWRGQSVAARQVQRAWKRHVYKRRLLETRHRAIDLTRRMRAAMELLDVELAALEERCQPGSGKAISPAIRVLALVRGRVLDSCGSRIRGLVKREVETRSTDNYLSRADVREIVKIATMGLFPEDEFASDEEDGGEEEEDAFQTVPAEYNLDVS